MFDNLDGFQVAENQTLTFLAFACDPDNPGFALPSRNADGTLTPWESTRPTVTYAVSGLPAGATFDRDTAVFSWTPGYADAGSYQVTFTATDDGDGTGTPLSTTVTVPLTVLNVNRPPVVTPIVNQTDTVGLTDTADVALHVTGAPFGLRTLALDSHHQRLYATAPGTQFSFDVGGSPGPSGHILVVDVNNSVDDPLFVTKYRQQVRDIVVDVQPRGITASSDPRLLVFTNSRNVMGVGNIRANASRTAWDVTYTPLTLGQIDSPFGVRRGQSLVVLPDLSRPEPDQSDHQRGQHRSGRRPAELHPDRRDRPVGHPADRRASGLPHVSR